MFVGDDGVGQCSCFAVRYRFFTYQPKAPLQGVRMGTAKPCWRGWVWTEKQLPMCLFFEPFFLHVTEPPSVDRGLNEVLKSPSEQVLQVCSETPNIDRDEPATWDGHGCDDKCKLTARRLRLALSWFHCPCADWAPFRGNMRRT